MLREESYRRAPSGKHQRPQQDDRHQRRGGRERDQQDGARVVEVITRQKGHDLQIMIRLKHKVSHRERIEEKGSFNMLFLELIPYATQGWPPKHRDGAAISGAETQRLLRTDKGAATCDEILRLALTKLVEIVGEAAKGVSVATRSEYSTVPWEEAARTTAPPSPWTRRATST